MKRVKQCVIRDKGDWDETWMEVAQGEHTKRVKIRGHTVVIQVP